MKLQAWLQSDVGNIRTNNEDSAWLGTEFGVFLVADGVGGRIAGEVASATVASVVESHAAELATFVKGDDDELDEERRDAISSRIVHVLSMANEAIYQRSREDGYPGGMATTADILVLTKHAAFIGHVGDSRVYLLRDGEIYRITEDHTFAESLRNDSSLAPESLQSIDLTRFEHVLTRSLGPQPRIDVDVLYVERQPGDRFLMCTDGLTDYLKGTELLEFAQRYQGVELLNHLIEEAKRRGGADNITCIHVDTGQVAGRPMRDARMDTIGKIDFLEDVALFQGLKPVEILKLLRFVFERAYHDGEVIFRQNDQADNIYIIVRGSVSLFYDGTEFVRLERGAHFGEHAMFLGRGRATEARCVQDGTLLLAIPTTKIEQFAEAYPEIGVRIFWNMLKLASLRLEHMNELLASAAAGKPLKSTLQTFALRDDDLASQATDPYIADAPTLEHEAVHDEENETRDLPALKRLELMVRDGQDARRKHDDE